MSFTPTLDTVNFEEESIDKAKVAELLQDQANLDQVFESLVARLDQSSNFVRAWYIGHSGGKDSCLVTALVNECESARASNADTLAPIIHTAKPRGIKNETHPLTVEFLYELSSTSPVLYVSEDLFAGGASKLFRVQIDGTRADEAERSNGRSTDLVINGEVKDRAEMGFSNPKGLFGLEFIYPIFDVTTPMVWALLIHKRILISNEYKKAG